MRKTRLTRGCTDYVVIALVALTTLLVVIITACDARKTEVTRVNGMPLDSVTVAEYDRPVWLPECEHAYKVFDRQTGDAWWLLVTSDGCVTLPLGADDDRGETHG